MELEIQKFLRANENALEVLAEKPYSINIKQDGDLFLFKYGIESAPREPMVHEARGLILDKANNWNIICHPFHRFFNIDEVPAAEVSEPFHVYSKEDGTLSLIWYYNNEWHFSTSGTINAMESKFWPLLQKALASYGMDWRQFTAALHIGTTYMYELCTVENRIVVPYHGYHLFYLGERDANGIESFAPDPRTECVRVFDFSTLEDVRNGASLLPPTEEGYVVRDDDFNRIKVKNPEYFLLHRMANNGCPDLWAADDLDELVSYFPEFSSDAEKIKAQKSQMEALADNFAAHCRTLFNEERKLYAEYVNSTPPALRAFLFKLYDNHDYTWAAYTSTFTSDKWKQMARALSV